MNADQSRGSGSGSSDNRNNNDDDDDDNDVEKADETTNTAAIFETIDLESLSAKLQELESKIRKGGKGHRVEDFAKERRKKNVTYHSKIGSGNSCVSGKTASSRNAASLDLRNMEDSILDSIQPLPLPQEGETSVVTMPGAEAVPGPLAYLYPLQHVLEEQEDQNQAHVEEEEEEEEKEEEHVFVNEAVLVSPSQELAMETAPPRPDLVHAKVLLDDEPEEEEEEEEEEEKEDRTYSSCWWIFVCSVLLLGVVAITVTMVLVPRDIEVADQDQESAEYQSHSSSPSGTDTTGADTQVYPPFDDDLPLSTIKDIQTTGSPWYSANKWMLDDPWLYTYTTQRQWQRFFLATIYYATNGETWNQNDLWLDYNATECTWFSNSTETWKDIHGDPIPVCDDDSTVISINLASNNLQGTFPSYNPANPLLPKLRVIDIAHNNLRGSMPPISLSSRNLEVLIMNDNHFEGPILVEGELLIQNLRTVNVSNNRIQGSNACENFFPLLTNVEVYEFSGNLFSGAVCTELGLLTNLVRYSNADNLKEGPLPSEIGLLSKLEYFSVADNSLTGLLPSEVALMTSLKRFDISGTWLSGSIPSELCNVKEVLANCSMIQCCN